MDRSEGRLLLGEFRVEVCENANDLASILEGGEEGRGGIVLTRNIGRVVLQEKEDQPIFRKGGNAGRTIVGK